LAVILEALDGPLAGDEALSRGIVLALLGSDSGPAPSQLSGAGGRRVRAILDGLLADARATAAAGQRPPRARAEALRSLRFAALGDVQALLTGLLAPRQPPDVQAAAIETLTRFDDAGVPAILLGAWRELSPKLRATAAEALFTRPAWLAAFLDAV